jgi:cytochrome oxidase Cu insertion factor (SCO1/SenC/PrrC family)
MKADGIETTIFNLILKMEVKKMKAYKTIFTLSLAVLMTVSFSLTVYALSRDELGKYKEKAIMAPDFTLKDLKGKTHKLSDYKGKIVVIQTGSST